MKNAFGYLLGFLLFVVGLPALMWWASGMPSLLPVPVILGGYSLGGLFGLWASTQTDSFRAIAAASPEPLPGA